MWYGSCTAVGGRRTSLALNIAWDIKVSTLEVKVHHEQRLYSSSSSGLILKRWGRILSMLLLELARYLLAQKDNMGVVQVILQPEGGSNKILAHKIAKQYGVVSPDFKPSEHTMCTKKDWVKQPYHHYCLEEEGYTTSSTTTLYFLAKIHLKAECPTPHLDIFSFPLVVSTASQKEETLTIASINSAFKVGWSTVYGVCF